MFKFKNYSFNKETFVADFRYEDKNGIEYTESIHFVKNLPYNPATESILEHALELSFLLIGTSYYKAFPTSKVSLDLPLDDFKAEFLNLVYNEGLSQFAFENGLSRSDLANFSSNSAEISTATALPYKNNDVLALQSGGKDSILTATILNESGRNWTAFYAGSTEKHPHIIDELGVSVDHVVRVVDIPALKRAALMPDYKNGHIPITYILMSLALVQAILDQKTFVLTSIGHEGEEPHSIIESDAGALAVNHQWSKTWTAEKYFAEYVHRYISGDLQVGSLLRGYSELKIAEVFTEKCWDKFSRSFSSCNVANYRQQNDNSRLTWCADCAKCANSYLIFAPFVEPEDLIDVFGGKDLFASDSLADTFRGLLAVDGFDKPFECVGEVEELRQAYAMKRPGYADLPFEVPKNQDYDYRNPYEVQDFVKNF